jgi:hypothetical protein
MPRDENTGRRKTKKAKELRNKELSGKYNQKAVRLAETKAKSTASVPKEEPKQKGKKKGKK